MKKTKKTKQAVSFKCEHCGPIYTSHFGKWSEDLFFVLFPFKISQKRLSKFALLIDSFLLKIGLLELTNDIENKKIYFRTKVFIKEALKDGIKIKALKSKHGFINRFQMEHGGKRFYFEGFPRAEFLNGSMTDKIDDKVFVKKVLQKNNIPSVKGRYFWFFQKSKAIRYAEKNLSYPLIVKPRSGSMSQHVTQNINSRQKLIEGIKVANKYSPFFVIEEFLPEMNVYRATVIDNKEVAVVKRIPAHIVGDGKKTIQELIELKNQEPERGEACSEDCTTFKLIFNETSEKILQKRGLSLKSVLPKGEKLYIQEKVILDIGADIEEVTETTHSDNKELFLEVSRVFGIKVVGIDFLAKDISMSWKNQTCAIIELNSLPYIDTHHHPTYGDPVNIGKYIVEMVKRYYK
uniref:ATP-grasp domain-containing protein n=1 Tax=candidate division CPR3 bacterium TaxID=2268181 RepID=A0A7C4M5C8_UNCC3